MTTITLRSPAAAIAWQFWTRHRSGVLSSLATLAVAAVAYPWLFALSRARWLVTLSVVPLVSVYLLILRVFGMADDPANPARGYPQRMLALPVPTRTLVFWPMALGAAVMAFCWLATACLVYRPSGFSTPILLPALGLAAALAWLQALSWTPLASMSFRVVASAVLLTVLAALPITLEMLHLAPRWVVELLVASYLPAAFLLAWAGVRSDRRGDSWYVLPERLRLNRFLELPAWRRPFRSAAAAQAAYDWRNHGLFLPAAPGFILTAFLLFAPVNLFYPSPGMIESVLAASIGMTLYTAAASGTVFAAMKPFWAIRSKADAFVMTRPVTSGALVTAKLRAAWRSTLLTWTILVVGVALWVVVAGAGQEAVELWKNSLGRLPVERAALVLALAVIVLPGVTWTLATQMLAVGLSGRNWLIGLVFTGIWLLLSAAAAGQLWCEIHPEYRPILLATVPWLVVGAAGVKAIVALWAFPTALGRGLIGWSSLLVAGAVWLGLFACVATLAILLWPSPGAPVTMPVALLGVATFLPLGRFALAPLALDWNRHR
jgi:hypothetical protein